MTVTQVQPKCENCLHIPFNEPSSDFKPQPCPECHLAFFCSEECQKEGLEEHRSRHCAQLSVIKSCEIKRLKHLALTGEVVLQLPTPFPLGSYWPLSGMKGWHKYFAFIVQVPGIEKLYQDLSPRDDSPETQDASSLFRIASEQTSATLTVMAALEAVLPDLETRSNLTIHIIGATGQEFKDLMMNEEYLHRLPALKNLVVGYFGPDLPILTDETPLLDQNCCPECNKQGRCRKIFCVRGLYHEYKDIELARNYPPDILVAFHSGFVQVEKTSWRPTIRHILDSGTPATYTTYIEQEAKDELRTLKGMGAHTVRDLEENKWRGQEPRIDYSEGRYN